MATHAQTYLRIERWRHTCWCAKREAHTALSRWSFGNADLRTSHVPVATRRTRSQTGWTGQCILRATGCRATRLSGDSHRTASSPHNSDSPAGSRPAPQPRTVARWCRLPSHANAHVGAQQANGKNRSATACVSASDRSRSMLRVSHMQISAKVHPARARERRVGWGCSTGSKPVRLDSSRLGLYAPYCVSAHRVLGVPTASADLLRAELAVDRQSAQPNRQHTQRGTYAPFGQARRCHWAPC